jgi:hypothetical protein
MCEYLNLDYTYFRYLCGKEINMNIDQLCWLSWVESEVYHVLETFMLRLKRKLIGLFKY